MNKNIQIQSAEGQWASAYEFFITDLAKFNDGGWLCEDFVKKLQKAALKAPAGSELAQMAQILAGLPLKSGPELILPHDEASKKTFEKELAKAIKKSSDDDWGTSRSGEAPEARKERVDLETRPKKKQRWILIPRSPGFVADPGKATKMGLDAAQSAIDRAGAMIQASKLLAKAKAQAAALGAAFEPWELPSRKLGKGLEQMAGAKAVEFVAAQVYAQRSCFAIYVGGNRQGFESSRKDVRPDLGSARLFPDAASATRYAKARYGKSAPCAVVAVDISPKSFTPAGPGDFSELASVIAAKEKLALDLAITSARVEALEAELRRRQSLEAPAPKKGARL